MNQLDQLKQLTTVVADTGNFHDLARFAPRDATTNPSLLLKAVQQAEFAPVLAPATLARARQLVALYAAAGVGRERVLIKIAATWEGIRAFAADAGRRDQLNQGLP